jgi:ubiquitin conjugation factor E4 B
MGGWTNRTLGGIFRITLDANNTRDAHGHRLYFASGVKGDLEDESKPLQLSTEVLDQAILESASNQTEGKPLEYLLGCWKRASKMFRGMHNKNDPKYEVAREARRICFNYCIFAATMPDMFGGMDTSTPTFPLAEHLLADPESDRGLCHDFINEAVSRFNDEENGAEVKQLLVETTEEISRRLAKLSMNDDYKPYILAMRNFVRYPPLLAAISQSASFLPNVQAQQIESRTLLGPFFRLSPMQGEVALNYFASHATRDKGYIANSQNALRMTLQTHQDELFDIANCFIKSSKESRDRILDWFALSVNANHKRRALQVDAKTVSSDGFMVNVTVILDRLCEPFMDATFSKIDRIDIDYLRRSPRVNITDETKINADQQTSDDFYAVTAGGVNNFITEVFFLTVAAHHYGTEAANTKVSQLQKDVKWLEKQLAKMETERHKYMAVSAVMYRLRFVRLTPPVESRPANNLRRPRKENQGPNREGTLHFPCHSGRSPRRHCTSALNAIHAIRHNVGAQTCVSHNQFLSEVAAAASTRRAACRIQVFTGVFPGRHRRQLQIHYPLYATYCNIDTM